VHLDAIDRAVIKGTRVLTLDDADVNHDGLGDDRRYVLVDDNGRQLMAHTLPSLSAVEVSSTNGGLSLCLPNGSVVDGPKVPGDDIETFDWENTPRPGRLVDGAIADALSEYAGRRLRLVDLHGFEVTGSDVEPVTLLSRQSVEHLAERMGMPDLDHRRFRCNLIVDAGEPHGEDEWIGSTIEIGDVQLEVIGQIPRCAVVTRSPLTGERDADVLRAVQQYRGSRTIADGRRKVFFGVYARVARAGTVHVGDEIRKR
jgi:MOSC domain-containing protein